MYIEHSAVQWLFLGLFLYLRLYIDNISGILTEWLIIEVFRAIIPPLGPHDYPFHG